MNRSLKDYDRAIDEAKNLLDDLYAEIDEMADAMSEIYDLADCVGQIQTIAGNHC